MCLPSIYDQTNMYLWLLLPPSLEMLFLRLGPDTLFVRLPFLPAQNVSIIPHHPLKSVLYIPPSKHPIPRHPPWCLLTKKPLVHSLTLILHPGRIWIQRLLHDR